MNFTITEAAAMEGINGPASPSANKCQFKHRGLPSFRPVISKTSPPRCSPQRKLFTTRDMSGASGNNDFNTPIFTKPAASHNTRCNKAGVGPAPIQMVFAEGQSLVKTFRSGTSASANRTGCNGIFPGTLTCMRRLSKNPARFCHWPSSKTSTPHPA